ncbi:MAG: tryptophan synthase beta chain [Desulfomicrobiaceae bacterium]|nr:tryptophan synthase beta chain [Desulfomicrobiaceae bacterium]
MILPRHFGPFGGRYVPEMLIPALDQLEAAFVEAHSDSAFHEEFQRLLACYCGRPTPLYPAENLTRHLGGCQVFLKLESLNHTGAHKITNALGQALLARRMGKTRLIAETGAGQHGLATATVAARCGMQCTVFMGEVDVARQYPNVFAMRLLGADVVPVADGTRTLKDAVNAALKDWIQHLDSTHYVLGSALGPHPYPTVVREFQSVIGREVAAQLETQTGQRPGHLVACVGGGSNSMGLFAPFLGDPSVRLYGAEAGGRGPNPGDHAARLQGQPKAGIVQGYKSYFLQDDHGQVQGTHSISAGLDYAGIGPELAWLFDQGRVAFTPIPDAEALAAYQLLARLEGIIPALESSHAVALAMRLAPSLPPEDIMVVNISGRGDKDLFITARALDAERWISFLQSEVERDQ